MEKLEKQPCPMCKGNTLTLTEEEREVPYFGKVFVFSMTCSNCKYHKADVEVAEKGEPSKYTIEINGEEDMKVRIVKSSEATIKIPHVVTIEPGPASSGFITNVEGILNRIKHQIESAKESEEDPAAKKKAKNLLKKLNKVIWGQEKLKIIIEDPSGNSAIISDKAVKSKLK
ncbi:ZPR1 zinc finger domain-containing protein [Candidatus Woesearchaeota archaeon]|nr:ZPR1 zinc finger domain-containing protein [Candidatus Woesearchaeota archaeon]